MSKRDFKEWDRVRVATGEIGDEHDNPVWQGFYAGQNMAGVDVWVTADTLRAFVADIESAQDAFDRLNNPLDYQNEALAFGGSAYGPASHFAPDGVTPVYLLSDMQLDVVQWWDPTAGRTHQVRSGGTVTHRPNGAWLSVGPVWGNPKPYGFVIHEQDYLDGRSDDQPFLRDGVTPPTVAAYYDHTGFRTADPRCELGLCETCIDSSLSRGDTPAIPALSTHDPKYGKDHAYTARVRTAYEVAGVAFREAAEGEV